MNFAEYKNRSVAMSNEIEALDIRREYPLGEDLDHRKVSAMVDAHAASVAWHARRGADATMGMGVSIRLWNPAPQSGSTNGITDLTPRQLRMLARIRETIDAWVAGQIDDLPETGTKFPE